MAITFSRMTGIITKYHGPSNIQGSRISADAGMGRRVYVSYDYGAGGDDAAHAKAAQALMDKMGWTGDLRAAGYEKGFYFVMTEK